MEEERLVVWGQVAHSWVVVWGKLAHSWVVKVLHMGYG